MAKRGSNTGAKRKSKMLKSVPSAPVNLDPPADLQGKALEFFERHAKPLADADMLSSQDFDSFILLCRLFELTEQAFEKVKAGELGYRPYQDLVNSFTRLSRAFGMLPKDRKQMAVSFGDNMGRWENTAEFDF